MNARPAACLKCPHPATSHGPRGCTPAAGMCACDVPRDRLPDPPSKAAWESGLPTPDPVEDPLVDVIPEPEPEPAPDPGPQLPPAKPFVPTPTVGGRNYDWTAAKRLYVEGARGTEDTIHWPSLREVAAHFDYPEPRVRERSSAEGWVEARRQFQAKIEQTRQQARVAALTKKSMDLDDRAIGVATLGIQLAQNLLATRAGEIKAGGEGNEDGRPRRTINALELSRIAQAVDLFHKIGLRAVGDPQVTRLEVTGAGGAPIEIAQELRRDDPDRITGVLAVLQQAGLGDIFGAPGPGGSAGGALEAHRHGDGSYEALPPGR